MSSPGSIGLWTITTSFLRFGYICLALYFGGDMPAQCPCDDLPGFEAFLSAVDRAELEDIHLIAAAGNDGDFQAIRAPACFEKVFSVGASYDAAFDRAPDSGTLS